MAPVGLHFALMGGGVCGPCSEAGTPGRVAARSHCPGCLLLSVSPLGQSTPWGLSLLPSSLGLWTWLTGPGFLLLVKGAQVSWHTAVLPQLSGVVTVLW